MDKTQLTAFIDYMVGDRTTGGNSDDPSGTPHSPELRAFILARLGDETPAASYYIVPQPPGHRARSEASTKQAKALAALLREVADGIDPIPVAPDENA